MFTSTMPEAVTPGADRAVALCRDLIGLAGHDRGWPTRQFPAEGTARHVELDAEERRARVKPGGYEAPRGWCFAA